MTPDGGGPLLDERGLTFRLRDRARRLTAVHLVQDAGLAADLGFLWSAGFWRLTVPRPEVDRLEYLFELDAHGHRETILDPMNPWSVDGAFGRKSVAVLPGYEEPRWVGLPEAPAGRLETEIAGIETVVWAPEVLADDDAAPLVVVHDGPEFDRLGGFTAYAGALVAGGALPPLRVALLDPGDRNAWYAADEDYARSLATGVVAELRQQATVVVGVGASLGALAMLHAHCRFPEAFDGLMLQSGSFFTPDLDPQERDFSGFERVTSFVAELSGCSQPVPTVLTCGTVEENLANNRSMCERLEVLGYPARLVIVRDAHNYTAWRDTLDPHLTRLVLEIAGTHAA